MLHYIRMRRRLSQKQVAHLLGHSDATMLSRYERGLVVPPLRTALKLTMLYGIPVQEIFKEELNLAKEEIAEQMKSVRLKQPVLF